MFKETVFHLKTSLSANLSEGLALIKKCACDKLNLNYP